MKIGPLHCTTLVLGIALLGLLATDDALAQGPPAGWGAPKELARSDNTLGEASEQPTVLVALRTVYVAYKQRGLHLLRSDDYGKTWKGPFAISPDVVFNRISLSEQNPGMFAPDYAPALLRTRDSLEAVWSNYTGTNYHLVRSVSTDNGETWSAPETLHKTDDHAFSPRLLTVGQEHYLIWFEIQPTGAQFRGRTSLRRDTLVNEEATGLDRVRVDFQYGETLQSRDFTFSIYMASLVPRTGSLRLPLQRFNVGVPVIPRVFTAFADSAGAMHILWNEQRNYKSIVTRDGGANFQTTAMGESLAPNTLLSLAFGDGGIHMVSAPFQPFQAVPLTYSRFGVTSEPQVLAGNLMTMETPRIAVAGKDIHIAYTLQSQNTNSIVYLRTDSTPPTATIVEPRSPEITTPTMTVRWTGQDDYSPSDRLVYRYHTGADWTPFSRETQVEITTMPDGEYEFMVQARDEAGNVQEEPTVFRFNTFKVAPEALMLTQVPDVVRDRSLTLEWTGTDNSTPVEELEYSHRLDGGPWSEFSGETTTTLTNLREGRHVFEIRSRDEQGNIQEYPTRQEFEVRLDLALEFVTALPDKPINTDSLTLEWIGSDSTDDDAPGMLYSYRRNFGSWSQPFSDTRMTFENLDEGNHTIEIKGMDQAGNETAAALRYEFTVDLTPPVAAPIPQDRNYTSRGVPRIPLAGTDETTHGERLRFFWSYDGETWQPAENPKELQPDRPLRWYSPGYTVHVVAEDEAGNRSEPVAISYELFDRNPSAKLYLAGAGGLTVLLLLVAMGMVVSRAMARSRRRKRAMSRQEEDEFSIGSTATAATSQRESPRKRDNEQSTQPEEKPGPPPLVELDDPFASDADPFASDSDPFSQETDPFATPEEDPESPSDDKKDDDKKDPFA